jgi:hypothetical protein
VMGVYNPGNQYAVEYMWLTTTSIRERGHFYLGESGHLYLATTILLRIMKIMANN